MLMLGGTAGHEVRRRRLGVRTTTLAEVTLEGTSKGSTHYIAVWKYVSLDPVRAMVHVKASKRM